MKFWLELVSCCGCHESNCGGASPESERPSEETTLVPVVRRSYRRRRRGRINGGGSGGADGDVKEWKPWLYAIAEDKVLMERQRSDSDKVVKRKSEGFKRVRSFSRDFGKSSMPPFVPAFSPTPFMF